MRMKLLFHSTLMHELIVGFVVSLWVLCGTGKCNAQTDAETESGVDLTQHFDLPICCYGGQTPIQSQSYGYDTDSDTAYSSKDENKYNSSVPKPKLKIRVYKISHPLNSNSTVQVQEIRRVKVKRDLDQNQTKQSQSFKTFDKVKFLESPGHENTNISPPIPTSWEGQLRKALFDGMRSTQTSLSSTLWENLKHAPLAVIDPSTRTLSSLQTQPDLSRNFSGVMVNTESGLEMRTGASTSNLVNSDHQGSCDCPLIQRGDMVLAYWSVNTHPSPKDNGESVVEYGVYPLPHNVPTPPHFIPFTPDLTFRPSQPDFNAHSNSYSQSQLQLQFHEEETERHGVSVEPHPHPHGYYHNPPIPHPGLGDIERNILSQTPPGYTPGFLDWYRGVLDNHFRFPRGHEDIPHPIPFHPHPHPLPHSLSLPPQPFLPFPPNANPQLLPHPPPLPPPQLPPLPPNIFPPPGQGPQEPIPIPMPPNDFQNPELNENMIGGIGGGVGGVAGGGGQTLPPRPLPFPNHPSLNHPKSIQEIISNIPGPIVLDHPHTQIQIQRDCQHSQFSSNDIDCQRGSLPPYNAPSHSKNPISKKSVSGFYEQDTTRTKKSLNLEQTQTHTTDPPTKSNPKSRDSTPGSRESGYILNF